MGSRPRVTLISTGGTIDSLGATRLDLARYYEHDKRLGVGELRASLPELEDIAVLEEVPFRRLSSYALSPHDWLDLRAAVVRALEGDVAGVVVTHGTNTLEETAFFLQLSVTAEQPIVLVGAMRPAGALGADGPLNLVRAVQVAAAEQSRGHGVLVVMNDTIYSARDVTKSSTFRVQAFSAGDLGPIGYADADGVVRYYHRHMRVGSLPVSLEGVDALPRVDVVLSHVGADGVLIDAAVAAGARGIVSGGTGSGRPTPEEEAAFDRAAARGVVVCQSTRVGSGRVPAAPCNRRVTSDNLPPWKARVALTLALTQTSDLAEVQRLLDVV